MFKTLAKKIDGKKSYALAIALAVYAVLGVVLGKVSLKEAIDLLFGAGAISTLRHAIE